MVCVGLCVGDLAWCGKVIPPFGSGGWMAVYGDGTAASGSTTARDTWLLLFSLIPAVIAWGRPDRAVIANLLLLELLFGQKSRLGGGNSSNSECCYYLSYYLDQCDSFRILQVSCYSYLIAP